MRDGYMCDPVDHDDKRRCRCFKWQVVSPPEGGMGPRCIKCGKEC